LTNINLFINNNTMKFTGLDGIVATMIKSIYPSDRKYYAIHVGSKLSEDVISETGMHPNDRDHETEITRIYKVPIIIDKKIKPDQFFLKRIA